MVVSSSAHRALLITEQELIVLLSANHVYQVIIATLQVLNNQLVFVIVAIFVAGVVQLLVRRTIYLLLAILL